MGNIYSPQLRAYTCHNPHAGVVTCHLSHSYPKCRRCHLSLVTLYPKCRGCYLSLVTPLPQMQGMSLVTCHSPTPNARDVTCHLSHSYPKCRSYEGVRTTHQFVVGVLSLCKTCFARGCRKGATRAGARSIG